MQKILSLIVPTYNMEAYLRRCLDSVSRAEVPSSLQVIVVNDGSKDSSLSIAKEYEARRPDLFVVVDKPNGNYGSCVNAALPIAEGRFVKMLDADDWYDTDGLIKLLGALESCQADMFISHYCRVFADGRVLSIPVSAHWEFGRVYGVDDVFATDEFMRLQMHQIGFRTQLLRSIGYVQTEGISYTDMEWTYMPLFNVKNVQFFDADVYRYFIGREGQTMQASVFVRSLSHEVVGLMSMLDFRDRQSVGDLGPNLSKYLSFRTINRAMNIYFKALVCMDDSQFASLNLDEVDRVLKARAPQEFNGVASYDKRGLLVRRWRNRGCREVPFVRNCIAWAWSVYSRLLH